MDSNFSSIDEEDIERWVGSASFEKGEDYFDRGMIFHPRRQGDLLKARCHGSQAAAYQVEAKLGPGGIVSAHCSCPVGAGGDCKHIAALLLTWLDGPDDFQEMEALVDSLEKRSKAELIALIQMMLEREPNLEILLEMPVPGETPETGQLDPDLIRKQVEHAFQASGDDYGWADPVEIARDLKPLFNLASHYAGRKDFENAATVYRTIAETMLDYEDDLRQDEEGDLGSILGDCIVGLEECLGTLADPDQRRSALRVVFDIYALDHLEMGGIGISDDAPEIFVERTTPQEREEIVQWIRAAMPSGKEWSDKYHRQILGDLRLALQADQLDDEAFLALCRQTGLIYDLVDRLLSLGRLEEALLEAGQGSDYELLGLADIFVLHGHESQAQALVSARAETSIDSRLIEWLKEYAQRQGNYSEALQMAEKLFWMHPSIEAYVEMRKLAKPLDQWQRVQNETREKLTQMGNLGLLTRIYLEDKEIDLALETLEKARAADRYAYLGELPILVAEAAHEQRPHEAVRLYMQTVNDLINARGRDNYAQAAAYLKQVKEIYHRTREPQVWQKLIANLREQNRNLPALKDELNRAKLE